MAMDWKDTLAALIPDDYKPDDADTAMQTETPGRQNGRLKVYVERKGRAGKVATIVTGFTLSDEAVAEVASQLKRNLGTGGSARGGEILIQGDRADAVVKALAALGYKASKG